MSAARDARRRAARAARRALQRGGCVCDARVEIVATDVGDVQVAAIVQHRHWCPAQRAREGAGERWIEVVEADPPARDPKGAR